MITLRDKAELVDFISKAAQTNNIKIISVDGIDGCGKTTLAKELVNNLDLTHINLDEYLIKNKGTYVNYIKYKILKQDISKKLANNKVIIIDGICILKVLESIKIKSDFKIYVKKLRWGTHWLEGQIIDYSKNVDEVLKTEEETLRKFCEINAKIEGKKPGKFVPQESIFQEIVRYHFEYRPNLNADVIFERTDDQDLQKI